MKENYKDIKQKLKYYLELCNKKTSENNYLLERIKELEEKNKNTYYCKNCTKLREEIDVLIQVCAKYIAELIFYQNSLDEIDKIIKTHDSLPCGKFCDLNHNCFDKVTEKGTKCYHRGSLLIQEKIKRMKLN